MFKSAFFKRIKTRLTQKKTNNEAIRRSQYLLTSLACLLLLLFAWAVSELSRPEKLQAEHEESITNDFTIRVKDHDKHVFVATFENRVKALENEISRLDHSLKRIDQKIDARDMESRAFLKESRATLKSLSAWKESEDKVRKDDDTLQHFRASDHEGGPFEARYFNQTSAEPAKAIAIDRLKRLTIDPREDNKTREHSKLEAGISLMSAPKVAPPKGLNAKNYIPSGTFVRAKLLNGVYASTGGAAAASPMPILMKLENEAFLPNAWRHKVKACHLTASGTGDISSERVLVRLDRLSCVGKTGEVLDLRVTGYAVGTDGKTGIRGRLVTRSGQAIASALSVGIISGIGKAVSLSSQSTTTSITGTQTSSVNNPWKAGLGEGAADAIDRVADYYLKLADRIFPVLEINAGILVDLVFSQGAELRPISKKPNN